MNKVLEAKNVNRLVLHNLDLEIYDKDFTVVMGPSGAGKSTLLFALSGTDKIESGELFIDGQKISEATEKTLSKIRAEKIGFVFQDANLISNLSLYENVLVAGLLKKERTEEKLRLEIDSLFKKMNLTQAKDRLPSQCSGGEIQRCAIARAIINNPKIIFADEPTGALNRQNSNNVLDVLSSINDNGQTILMVTHDIRSASRGNRILFLDDGAIVSELKIERYNLENEKLNLQREEKISTWLNNLQW